MIGGTPEFSADFRELLQVQLGNAKSKLGAKMEFLGATIFPADSNSDRTAEPSDSVGRKNKLVALVTEMSHAQTASVASMGKLAGRLRFAQTAVTGRIGSVALEPRYQFVAEAAGKRPRQVFGSRGRRANILQDLTPRLIRGDNGTESGDTSRFSRFDSSGDKIATLPAGTADAKLRELSEVANEKCIPELFATAATAHRLVLLVGNKAACAAPSIDACNLSVAFIRLRSLWLIAER